MWGGWVEWGWTWSHVGCGGGAGLDPEWWGRDRVGMDLEWQGARVEQGCTWSGGRWEIEWGWTQSSRGVGLEWGQTWSGRRQGNKEGPDPEWQGV